MEPLSLGEVDGDGFLYEVSWLSSEGNESHVLREKREKEGRDSGTAKANLGAENMKRRLNRTDLSSGVENLKQLEVKNNLPGMIQTLTASKAVSDPLHIYPHNLGKKIGQEPLSLLDRRLEDAGECPSLLGQDTTLAMGCSWDLNAGF